MTSKFRLYRHLDLAERHPEDHLASLSAYRRLFEFSKQSGNWALAILAVYKALQKLEVDQNNFAPSEPGHNNRSDLSLPGWVYDGLWLTLESYLLRPRGLTAGGPRTRFVAVLEREWELHEKWCAVYMRKVEADM